MSVRAKRGTRTKINEAAGNGLLKEGELIYATDEGKFYGATGAGAYGPLGANFRKISISGSYTLQPSDDEAVLYGNSAAITLPNSVNGTGFSGNFRCFVAAGSVGIVIRLEPSGNSFYGQSGVNSIFVPSGGHATIIRSSFNNWSVSVSSSQDELPFIVTSNANSSNILTSTDALLLEPGDLILAIVESAAQAVSVPDGFTLAPNGYQTTGASGGTSSTAISVFYRVADGLETYPITTPNPGDHVAGRTYIIKNVDPVTPFDVTAGNVAATATTAVSMPSVTTTRNDCLIFSAVADATDTTTDQFTLGANSALKRLTKQFGGRTFNGNGGGISAATGIKSAPGATGATTGTLTTSSVQARWTGAINAK